MAETKPSEPPPETADGGGPYDEIATRAREDAGAEAVIMILIGGFAGDGFTVQQAIPRGGTAGLGANELIRHLRGLADAIEGHEIRSRSTVRFM